MRRLLRRDADIPVPFEAIIDTILDCGIVDSMDASTGSVIYMLYSIESTISSCGLIALSFSMGKLL